MEKKLRLDWEKFAQSAGHWLELFDKSFAVDSVPIHARPLQSAMRMLREAISHYAWRYLRTKFATILLGFRRVSNELPLTKACGKLEAPNYYCRRGRESGLDLACQGGRCNGELADRGKSQGTAMEPLTHWVD